LRHPGVWTYANAGFHATFSNNDTSGGKPGAHTSD
jgi:hypothetical protein